MRLGLSALLVLVWLLLAPSARVSAQDKKEPSYGGKSLSQWLQDLQNGTSADRAHAGFALWKIGAQAVPGLVDTLKGKDRLARSSALDTLNWIGPKAKAAVPALLTALREALKEERDLFGLGGPPRPFDLANTLKRVGAAQEAIPILVEALKNKDGFVRIGALRALSSLEGEAKGAVPALLAVLQDQREPEVNKNAPPEILGGGLSIVIRDLAAEALGRIGPEAKEAVPALLAIAKNPKDSARSKAISALGAIGPVVKEIMPTLLAIAKNPDDGARESAVTALGAIRPVGKEVVPALRSVLKAQRADHRRAAVRALGRIGPAAKEALPVIRTALKDPDVNVRIDAASALCRVGPAVKEAMLTLIAALKDPDEIVCENAGGALYWIGAAAVPPLIDILKSKDIGQRLGAAEALGAVGGEAGEAVPALRAALLDADEGVRTAAAEALEKIGP